MTPDPRQNVRPGEKLRIAAEQINFLNGLMRGGAGFAGGSLTGWQPGTNLILLKNTGADVARWGVFNITGIEIDPNTNEYQANSFGEMPCVRGEKATESTGTAAVAIEPIKSGKVGRVAVSGVVQIKREDVVKVVSAIALWQADEWALIRFGGGGIRLGTVSATWTKGATATVTQLYGDGTPLEGTPTFTATNHFVTIPVSSGTKRVACALVDATWILIAAECP